MYSNTDLTLATIKTIVKIHPSNQKVITISAKAGSGKTLIALKAAITSRAKCVVYVTDELTTETVTSNVNALHKIIPDSRPINVLSIKVNDSPDQFKAKVTNIIRNHAGLGTLVLDVIGCELSQDYIDGITANDELEVIITKQLRSQ